MKCSDKEWQHCNKEKMGCNGCAYNDEISIGEYVRTPKQGICIISHINKPFKDDDENKVCLCQNSKVAFASINTIKQLKHSKDIKDLLQIGDIITTNNLCGEITKIDGNTIYLANYMGTCKEEDIKSIITKEQIKQIEYRIKE